MLEILISRRWNENLDKKEKAFIQIVFSSSICSFSLLLFSNIATSHFANVRVTTMSVITILLGQTLNRVCPSTAMDSPEGDMPQLEPVHVPTSYQWATTQVPVRSQIGP
mmetsp:Transcript_27567/g.63206  ORF Transcript_27567/g.63206 Transcript_27567/m.63206 type:complete len:109 (+) Transcript_27567:357-683(+)